MNATKHFEQSKISDSIDKHEYLNAMEPCFAT